MAKKTEVIKINFNTLGKQLIGKPSSGDTVFYTKTDDYYKANANTNEAQLVLNNPKEKLKFDNTYNSPANIRRVFFTYNRVLINYYTPYILNGNKYSGGCWREVKLTGNSNLYEAIRCINNNVTNGANMAMQRSLDPKAPPMKRYNITGNIFKSLMEPVASNIEEIYFDFSYLLSEDILPMISNITEGDTVEQRQYYLANKLLTTTNVIKSSLPMDLFKDAGGASFNSRKNQRNSFPRLKAIIMVPKLDMVLEKCTGLLQRRELMFNTTYTKNNLWMTDEKIKVYIKNIGGTIIHYSMTDDLDNQPLKFNYQSGVYKFDSEILQPLFESHIQKIKQSSIVSKYENAEEIKDENKSVFENVYELLASYDNGTSGADLTMFMLARDKSVNKELNNIISDMPASKRQTFLSRYGLPGRKG